MLKDEIDFAKKTVSTDMLSISIGEISTMYEQDEINILPEFQRLFRWGPQKKSDFIESLLIGIPVPPAFAYERSDGTWELIDGLQRISTILEFLGILVDPDNPEKALPPSTLLKTKYLPSLEGVGWSSGGEDDEGIGKSLQLFLRRARIDFQVLKYPSDASTKFDLFQRLNRGGAYANPQEVRTCSMVLADAEFTAELRNICGEKEFADIFRLNEEQVKQQRDFEYLVRLACHTYYNYEGRLDVEEFLDEKTWALLTEQDQAEVCGRLSETIEILAAAGGADVFLPAGNIEFNAANRFSLRSLEVIGVGVASNIEEIKAQPDPAKFVSDRIEEFWRSEDAARMSTPGQRGTTRWGKTIPFGRDWFKPA